MMHKTALVFINELYTTFTRRSYLLFAYGIPLLAVLALVVVKFVQARSGSPGGSSNSVSAAQSGQVQDLEGFVDRSGLIHRIPSHYQVFVGSFGKKSSRARQIV